MRWVDRGPEPAGLRPIRCLYTPGWVQYYSGRRENKPSDSRWRGFIGDLGRPFHNLCAYCEELHKGEVDHFRPKKRFPSLVYKWSNWLFACHDCNHAKLEKWPIAGYVDPCSRSEHERPEHFFSFDTMTGEILPREGLSPLHREIAQNTITGLQLNRSHHLKQRLAQVYMLAIYEKSLPSSRLDIGIIRKFLESPYAMCLSFTRAWLSGRGYPAI